MADILSLVFRAYMPEKASNAEAVSGPPPPAACSALLLGERDVSRSVLLLAAVTAAAELGVRVAFFTHTQIQSLPLSLQRCAPNLRAESLKKIKFCYPRTVEELLQQVASLHESTNTSLAPPSLIIVERLECFLRDPGSSSYGGFHLGEQSSAAHLSALLCDTAAFLSRVLESQGFRSGPCRLIASFMSESDAERAEGGPSGTDPVLDVLDRYFQVRCTFGRDGGYGAPAAGAAELWSVYLSGRGLAETPESRDRAEDGVGATQEWQLFVFPDGLMEFKFVQATVE